MKSLIFSLLFIAIYSSSTAQMRYICKNGEAGFYSKTKLEDIEGKTKEAVSVMDTITNKISAKILIKTFIFKDKLMMEHFNENYLESDKYPYAIMDVKIVEPMYYYKDGMHKVTLDGTMDIHGVKKPFKCPATIEVKNKTIIGKAEFVVMLKDYNVDIPKIVVMNVADNVKVTVNFTYVPWEKKK
jgi:YceI-like domain